MSNQQPLSPPQLLALLEAAIKEVPEFPYGEALGDKQLRWLGRAAALLSASGSTTALVDFRTARSNLNTYSHNQGHLVAPLYEVYSQMELLVPSASQGAFIPAGDTWNGYAAIVKLLQKECDDLLLIDPYVNASLYTEFAPHAAARNGLRCLTTKRTENHAGLVATAGKWAETGIEAGVPVAVRYASAGALHDRLVIFDQREVWLISQSLKDIAKRSPASLSRAETELALLKARHYEGLWEQSIPLA